VLVIILFVGTIGMSHLDAVVGPSLREGALTLAMPPPASATALLGIPSAPTKDDPAHVDAPPTVISAASDGRGQVEPVVRVVSAVLRPSPAVAVARPVVRVVSAVLRPSPAVAVARPVVRVVPAALRPSPAVAVAVAVARPARQRADAKSKHTTDRAKASKTRTYARARNAHKPSSASRSD
jgi:hypothetical protein